MILGSGKPVEPIIRATKEEFCSAACQVQSRSFGKVLPASLAKILVSRVKVESSASLEGSICCIHKGIPRSSTYVISFCR